MTGRHAAASELTCCTLLTLGLLMPLGVAVGLGTMLVAGSSLSRSSRTFWNSRGGGEYPFFIGAVLAPLAFLGAGRLSLDATMDPAWYATRPTTALILALGTVALAFIAAIPPILRGRHGLTGR